MQLVIDGYIFEKANQSGIAQIFKNVIPLICEDNPNLKTIILFSEFPRIDFPHHNQISYMHLEYLFLLLRPRRFWRKFYKKIQWIYLKSKINVDSSTIWLSTYFTRPPKGWKGKEVVFVHDLIYELYPELLPESKRIIEMKRQAILAANLIFANSNNTKIDLLKFYNIPHDNIVVTSLSHDSIYKKREYDEIKVIRNEKFLLYVGRRHYYKNFGVLLDAYSNWKKANEVKLFVVGPVWTNEEKAQIKKRGLDKKIVLFPNIDDDKLCDLYNQAEAFIFTSRYEGFGIPLLEAMACGCPVIASRIPTTEEIAGDVPFYFDYDNPNSLIDSLANIENKIIVKEHIDRGLQLAQNYSWQKTATKMYEALVNVISKK